MSAPIHPEGSPGPPSEVEEATVRIVRGPAPPAPATSAEAEAPPPPIVDGRYQVESEVGRGAMGVVYLARDTWLDRPVALKMIDPKWAANAEAVASFQREARALASLRNQYVVQVYAFGLHGGSYFFAMEYVRGRTLRQILAEHRQHGDAVPPLRTLTILSRIAQGIDAVHAAGIVHRDIKPSNIVIEEHTGRPVLVDFGLAVRSEDPAAARAAGTPHYMAPEQFGARGTSITVRTDVYALGATAYEMLSGQTPFHGTDRAQLIRDHGRKKPPLLSSIRRDLAPFDRIVARALAKDPEERYPSCTAFAEVLAAAGDRLISSMLPTLPPPAPEPGPSPVAESVDGGIGEGSVWAQPGSPGGAPIGDWLARSLPSGSPVPELQSSRAAEPVPERPTPVPARPFHVLVVDDSPVFRKFTVQATQIAFYRHRRTLQAVVEGAGSGQEAIARAEAQPPDLVLLDFDMPGLDGVDTLSRLRAVPGGDRARVVVLSGRVGPADRWRFAVLGVNDFVSKPIDFRQLVDRIEGIARQYEERAREPQ